EGAAEARAALLSLALGKNIMIEPCSATPGAEVTTEKLSSAENGGCEKWVTAKTSEGEDLSLLMLRGGYVVVDAATAPAARLEEYLRVPATRPPCGPAIKAVNYDASVLEESRTDQLCVVEKVLSGTEVECFVPSAQTYLRLGLAGLEAAREEECVELLTMRVLGRQFNLRLVGTVDGRIYGALSFPEGGLVVRTVLEVGLGRLHESSAQRLRMAQRAALQNAVAEAKKLKVGIWQATAGGEDGATTASNTPTARDLATVGEFDARLADVFGTSSLLVLEGNPQTGVITPFSPHRAVYLSHLRGRAAGWLTPAREAIKEICGTRKLRIKIDYMRCAQNVDNPPRPSDDYGRLHYATVIVQEPGTKTCLNKELLRRGFARLDRLQNGAVKTSLYEEMEQLSRDSTPNNQPAPKFNDYIGPANTRRARQLYNSLRNESCLRIFVERVVTGTRYRAYVPGYAAMISVSLSGVTAPQVARRNVGFEDPEDKPADEPFANESIAWAELNVNYRPFMAQFVNCDMGGTFSSILTPPGAKKEGTKTSLSSVDLAISGTPLQETMLREGYAMVFDRFPGPHAEEYYKLEERAISEKKGIWSLEENVIYFGRKEDATKTTDVLGNWGDVSISHCESSSEVYVQKHSRTNDLLDIQRTIAREAVATYSTQSKTELPAKNSIILAKFEGEWYRARVLNVKSGLGSIEVFFLDYGNTAEITSLDDIAVLPTAVNVIAYPPLASRVGLAYIKNPSIDPGSLDNACDVIMEFGEEQTCQCECVGTLDTVPQVLATGTAP
ncbi:nuclease domain protein, partial [Gregarina niphandrodes]